ncbi:MAG: VOC family protein [Oscillospiraceae bacterium]|nr:VOC family protein [Oscillospiraceae bacterium]
MKLKFITLMVRDLKKSIAFYENLTGLRVLKRMSPGMGEIAFLANRDGETMLELIQFDSAEKVSAKGMTFSFLAEGDLEPYRENAVALGYNPSDIVTSGPKPSHFVVLDPDGVLVEISN